MRFDAAPDVGAERLRTAFNTTQQNSSTPANALA